MTKNLNESLNSNSSAIALLEYLKMFDRLVSENLAWPAYSFVALCELKNKSLFILKPKIFVFPQANHALQNHPSFYTFLQCQLPDFLAFEAF